MSGVGHGKGFGSQGSTVARQHVEAVRRSEPDRVDAELSRKVMIQHS